MASEWRREGTLTTIGSVVGLASIRQAFGNYDTGLYIAAGVLPSCVILTAFLPAYRYRASI